MDDQRVERRPALGRIDAGDRVRAGRVRGEAVDGLGRNRDRLAGADQPRRLGDRVGVGRHDTGVLRVHRPAL
jgi:hypothetical protein